MPEPRDFNRFAIVPVYADSTGHEAVPQNAMFVGSQSSIMERVLDSRARRTALTLINDAAHAREFLTRIAQRERDVAAREDAVTSYEDSVRRTVVQDFIGKLDALASRLDSLEQQAAHDPDDDELPPGLTGPSVDDSEGDLPPEIERRTPPGSGTDPIPDPRDLAHPQKPQQQPAAIEDDEHSLPSAMTKEVMT